MSVQQAVAMLEAVRRRMRASCGYTCRDLGGGVSCSSGVTTAAEVQQLLRFAAECTPWSEISDFRFVAMRRLAASLRRGGSAGRASVRLSIVWTQHANLNVTPVLQAEAVRREHGGTATRRADFVQLPSRGLVALLKEPLQSCDHPCGRFNFEVQPRGPLAPRGLDGRALSSGRSPR